MDHGDRARHRRRWLKPGYTRLCLLGALLAGGAIMLFWRLCRLGEQAALGANGLVPAEPLLVSYSYFEKVALQNYLSLYQTDSAVTPAMGDLPVTAWGTCTVLPCVMHRLAKSFLGRQDQMAIEDLRYFMAVGMGISHYHKAPVNTDVVLLVSGDTCTPCNDILQDLKANPSVLAALPATAAWQRPGFDLLQRPQTTDTDFAVHNITLEFVRQTKRYSQYSAFMFLNSGVRGPYAPSWVPPGWQWTMAFTHKLQGDVGAVSSSLTCLPPSDLGQYGPKMETWAVALRADAMDLVMGANIFELPPASSIVVPSYAMSRVLLQSGLTFTSLLSKYRGDVDWRGQQHWHCNNNIHPSRHGTYSAGGGGFGISIHPYETVFVPSSWFVGEPHMSFYTQWAMEHAVGSSGTDGLVDEGWYRYGISPKAIEPNNAQECFKIKTPMT